MLHPLTGRYVFAPNYHFVNKLTFSYCSGGAQVNNDMNLHHHQSLAVYGPCLINLALSYTQI